MQASQPQQRYRVLDRLASGGMAEVFIAESASIEGFKKRVAIKRVLPQLSEKTRFISMFLDEARLSAHLSHSNCVQVFDIGVGDNTYFIVMEYVDGADLKAVIEHLRDAKRPFPVELAVHVAAKICEGLAYAHELTTAEGKALHIVHRDMSPPNVLITKHGEVKIVDFGLAKASSQLEKSEPGIIKGKFGYLSPEAALGEEVDLRTDIFAVGIILWELLAGRRLFVGDTDFATVKLIQQAVVPSLRGIRSDVSEDLERILQRALSRLPNQRYASARDLGRDLTAFLFRFGRPVSAFDVAELVRGAMASRTKSTLDRGSIIDRLIEEALFEFTSLQKDGEIAVKERKSADPAPRPPGEIAALGEFGHLVDELSSAGRPNAAESELRASIAKAAEDIGLGDLSALEPDLAPPPASTQLEASQPSSPGYVTSASPGQVSAPGSGALGGSAIQSNASSQPQGSGSKALPIVLLLIVLVGGVAGAWFAGLIPH
jgi:serine/threonine protein kinase